MQSHTTFLSKLIGWYAALFALAMLLDKQSMVASVTALLAEPPLVLVLGVVILAAGLALVISHNVWSGGPQPLVVTLLGWATLIKGLILVFLSPGALQAYFASLHYAELFYVYALVTLVVGALLLLAAYGGRSSAHVS